jgi:class 3 adenylate cyclase
VSDSIELATILLTDLVGSTRLATSVGPVRADKLREEHFGLLREVIASCGGREVKSTGDGSDGGVLVGVGRDWSRGADAADGRAAVPAR